MSAECPSAGRHQLSGRSWVTPERVVVQYSTCLINPADYIFRRVAPRSLLVAVPDTIKVNQGVRGRGRFFPGRLRAALRYLRWPLQATCSFRQYILTAEFRTVFPQGSQSRYCATLECGSVKPYSLPTAIVPHHRRAFVMSR
jgi:hypothetical protein